MPNLILTILSIALQAAFLYSMMHYMPAWATTVPDYTRTVATGLSSIEKAFYRYGAANAGVMPIPTADADGGLSQFQHPSQYLPFLPNAPQGFSWKYGMSSNYYICLHATDGVQPFREGLYHGAKRLRSLLPSAQFVISAGAGSCGSDVDIGSEPATFPASLSITYFMRYAPGQLPSTAAFPCLENACLTQAF